MAPPLRPLRSDAARNRGLLLAAAEDEFAQRGLDASVADIARRAGVAKGTVFRHFATKEDLIAAIVGGHISALTAVARRLLHAADPGAALLEFLTMALRERQQRNLTFLQSVSERDSAVIELRDQLYASISALVDRARAGGAVRADVTATDVILLMCAPASVVEHLPSAAPDSWRRYLAIIFDGLSPQGARPLPCPSPTWP